MQMERLLLLWGDYDFLDFNGELHQQLIKKTIKELTWISKICWT